MVEYEPWFDDTGYPYFYDVTSRPNREGVLGTVAGTWLTDVKTGRYFEVKPGDFPLSEEYLKEYKVRKHVEEMREQRGSD